jgi:hypothetical protein
VKPDLLRVLLDADDPKAFEYPPAFDWKRETASVRDLIPTLEGITGQTFKIDVSAQDASFFADLLIVDKEAVPEGMLRVLSNTVVGIRFSSFGRLFTVWSACREERQLPPNVIDQVIQFVASKGYTCVDADSLEEPYSGANPGFEGVTWKIRFFDYL